DIQVKEAKLVGLNDLITKAEEEIEMKEAQLEVMGGVRNVYDGLNVYVLFVVYVSMKIESCMELLLVNGSKNYEMNLNGRYSTVNQKNHLKLHTNNDVHSFIDAAANNGSINLYVAHKKQNLGKYYYKNMEWQEDDVGLRCSSSTPFSTRVKTKRAMVIHDEGDDRKKSLVT
ncbi:hypothetical protein Tco_1147524, partial [Tanacetum coccineum]